MLNSPDRLTKTVDVAPEQPTREPTARTARAQKATAAGKSPKGKARRQTAKVAGQRLRREPEKRSLHRPENVSQVTVPVPRMTIRIVSQETSAKVAAMARTRMTVQWQGQVFRHCGMNWTTESNKGQVTLRTKERELNQVIKHFGMSRITKPDMRKVTPKTEKWKQNPVITRCGTSRTTEPDRSQVTPSKDDHGDQETECGGRRNQRAVRGLPQFHSKIHRL